MTTLSAPPPSFATLEPAAVPTSTAALAATVPLTIDPAIDATPAVLAPELAGAEAPFPVASVRGGVGVRRGTAADVPAVARIVAHWARVGENLPRTEAELVAAADDGLMAVALRERLVVACAILAPYDGVLAEIRSVGVDPRLQGGGAGSAVVRHLVADAALRNLRTVFVLTRAPGFFDRLGFVRTTIDTLPDKIRRDCIRCPRIDRCDEIAMVRPLGHGAATLGRSHA
jgi:N-acetylglutamate synthase-like GNAT family acetyltransferase